MAGVCRFLPGRRVYVVQAPTRNSRSAVRRCRADGVCRRRGRANSGQASHQPLDEGGGQAVPALHSRQSKRRRDPARAEELRRVFVPGGGLDLHLDLSPCRPGRLDRRQQRLPVCELELRGRPDLGRRARHEHGEMHQDHRHLTVVLDHPDERDQEQRGDRGPDCEEDERTDAECLSDRSDHPEGEPATPPLRTATPHASSRRPRSTAPPPS